MESREESRSARKHRLIMEAATAVFLKKGYLGASMDEVAATAGVSKQTVYKHFADKGRLFREISFRDHGRGRGARSSRGQHSG